MKLITTTAVAICLMTISSLPAFGQTQSVHFTATVTQIFNQNGNGLALASTLGIAVGNTITGRYFFSPNHPDSSLAEREGIDCRSPRCASLFAVPGVVLASRKILGRRSFSDLSFQREPASVCQSQAKTGRSKGFGFWQPKL